MKRRLLIGMSGASGAPIAVELLKQLKKREDMETHLIVTRGAQMTLLQECNLTPEQVRELADVSYENDAIGARVASGSFFTEGMIIVPCSMKTAAGIVSGYSDNLLLRAADVTLKERRKLVLVARESPLSTVHLRNLYELSRLGAVIIPPMLTYYNHPATLEDCTAYAAQRILRQFGLGDDAYEWEGM
ncbi:MAG: UbiX family flavin prenyltransferase [Eubacteriales bacterium]|nr:UbiX family flavin prenyltransferase [Eubacteriales bacterium]